jgi:transaldolase
MKIFLDTADIAQIEALLDTGMIDGVTTNPSLIAKSGGDIKQTIAKICDLVDGPVSAEVTATDIDTMMAEADVLSAIAPQVAVKVPLTKEGLIVCRRLSERDIMVNVTLCFSAGQALLAAKAGASFISPFVGRLDDLGADGMNLIADICTIYDHYDFDTEILVASARNPQHVVDAALLGADVITLPPAIIDQLYTHPLTDKGLHTLI